MIKVPSPVPSKPLLSIACSRQIMSADATIKRPTCAIERIVCHFQGVGFPGITEALLVRIRLKKGDRMQVEAAFEFAQEREVAMPVTDFLRFG